MQYLLIRLLTLFRKCLTDNKTQRDSYGKHRAFLFPAEQFNRSFVHQYNILYNCKSQTGTAGLTRPGLIDTIETVENMLLFFLRNPDAGVRNPDIKIFVVSIQGYFHPTTFNIVLNCVFNQIRNRKG